MIGGPGITHKRVKEGARNKNLAGGLFHLVADIAIRHRLSLGRYHVESSVSSRALPRLAEEYRRVAAICASDEMQDLVAQHYGI